MSNKNECLTLTIAEAARQLGIGRNAAYEAAQSGSLPALRIGRRLLVPKVAFDRLLNQAGWANVTRAK